MNSTKHSLFGFILFTVAVSAVLLTWVDSSSEIAIAQASLIPAPSLQEEEPVELFTPEVTTLPAEVQSAVLDDAVKRTSKTVAALKILEFEPQEWSDGCLGLGQPNELCMQVMTPGYQVIVTDGSRNWTYRTNETGNSIRLEKTT